MLLFGFFFNDTATTEIYTLSLHDALPISANSPARCGVEAFSSQCSLAGPGGCCHRHRCRGRAHQPGSLIRAGRRHRSEEHTSELQSRQYIVCRLLLEKKKTIEEQLLRVPE